MRNSRTLAKLARKESGRFLGRTMDRMLPMEPVSIKQPSTVASSIAAALAVRIATSSMPGAMVVGAGMLGRAMMRKGRKDRLSKQAHAATKAVSDAIAKEGRSL